MPSMPSINQAAVEILHRRGATEVTCLARAVRNATAVKKSEDLLLEHILRAALGGNAGMVVLEYPKYNLKTSLERVKLPTGGYARAALLALKEAREPMPLPEIAQRYCAAHGGGPRCPEFWMWNALRSKELSRRVASRGALCVGLTEAMRHEVGEVPRPGVKISQPRRQEPIAHRIDEKSLETLLVGRLDLLEPGLSLFQRQCRIPVGRIDLLCIDRNRNYVVVEIKRPKADFREVVGQITSYMGWVRKNIATKGQTARGIIVVGKQDERLKYSLESIPDVTVRTFF